MHKLTLASAIVAGLLSATGATAATINLDFNGVTDNASVNDFYNGGTDGQGASGTNYGVSFAPSVLGLTNANFTYFTNSPSNSAIYVNPNDVRGVMNIASGISGSLGVSYSSLGDTTVSVFGGLNGTDLLQTFTLTSNDDSCASGVACSWTSRLLNFSGVAESVEFGSNNGQALYTNIGVTPVPLPAAGLLLFFGSAGLGVFGARRRAA